jgi:hypothetical protein
MLKALARRAGPAVAAMTVTVALGGGAMASSSASAAPWNGGGGPLDGWSPAVTLSGDWAPFSRCPVDNPAMLAADGQTSIALCVAIDSPSGSVTIGNLTLANGESNTQFGLVATNGEFAAISPRGGAPVVAPVELPDGLPALLCPSASRGTRRICSTHGGGPPHAGFDGVTLSLEAAGEVSNFNLAGGLGTGVPIASLPVKLHLENPFLGPDCYLGTDSEPIVLQMEGLTPATSLGIEGFDSDGTPVASGESGELTRIVLLGASDGDSSFAVPAASGCGFGGQLDEAIDTHAGLPSPSGKNSIVLNETSTYLTGLSDPESVLPNDGKDLAMYWHSAVEEARHHGYGHHH